MSHDEIIMTIKLSNVLATLDTNFLDSFTNKYQCLNLLNVTILIFVFHFSASGAGQGSIDHRIEQAMVSKGLNGSRQVE